MTEKDKKGEAEEDAVALAKVLRVHRKESVS